MKNFFCSEGNIGRTPLLKEVSVKGGMKSVVEFDVKFSVDKLNKETGEYEDTGGFWATVSFWGKRAEHYSTLLQAGARVVIAGELSQESYIAVKGERAGQLIQKNNITAQHVGLALLGVKSVVYSGSSKSKSEPVASGDSKQSFEHAHSDVPLPDDDMIPMTVDE